MQKNNRIKHQENTKKAHTAAKSKNSNKKQDMTKQSVRLNKAIALSGYCSRRAADALIFDGKVSINGIKITDPSMRVSPNDCIAIDGKILLKNDKKIYLMLNKPIHSVSTVYDPEGRTTVLDFLPEEYKEFRLYPVGRLDYFSEGLLLLTNDGDLAYALMHPKFHLPKVYHVRIRGFVPKEKLMKMQEGMTLPDGQKLMPIKVHASPLSDDATLLTMTLHQGVNREIRKVCDALKLTILQLVRVAEGSLTLGDLPTGHVREIRPHEVAALYQAARGYPPTAKKTQRPAL